MWDPGDGIGVGRGARPPGADPDRTGLGVPGVGQNRGAWHPSFDAGRRAMMHHPMIQMGPSGSGQSYAPPTVNISWAPGGCVSINMSMPPMMNHPMVQMGPPQMRPGQVPLPRGAAHIEEAGEHEVATRNQWGDRPAGPTGALEDAHQVPKPAKGAPQPKKGPMFGNIQSGAVGSMLALAVAVVSVVHQVLGSASLQLGVRKSYYMRRDEYIICLVTM